VPGPTAVEVTRFEGWAERKGIHVEWETTSEAGNLDFNLYRASAPEGPYTKLNAELIPSQGPGHGGGAVYAWPDDEVRPARPCYYRLEDVDIYGGARLHGPMDVKSGPAAVRTCERADPQEGVRSAYVCTANEARFSASPEMRGKHETEHDVCAGPVCAYQCLCQDHADAGSRANGHAAAYGGAHQHSAANA
jgi:hypothetical protein